MNTTSSSSPLRRVTGLFDVKMLPQPSTEGASTGGGITLGRMLLDKRYHGALEATGQGQMLSAMTGTPGSAGYVAIEQVTGALDGLAGSFVLQHSGLMNRGEKQLVITVVPDSGSGALEGLRGQMNIRIENGQHFYDFDYALPEPA